MNPVRVLVVDDSAFMRQTLKAMIEEDSDLQVVATARDGEDALKKIARYHPDVVTLDIIMSGEKDGLQVLHDIMTDIPTPTIMVSGASDENVNYVIEAISNGAFDFIFKPSGKASEIERIELELQTKIKEASISKIHRTCADDVKKSALKDVTLSVNNIDKTRNESLVFIGTSTGGPRALQTVIPGLKKGLPAPVLVVQHMPPKFTKSLADRLCRMSELAVTEAVEGEVLSNGHVYIAPGGLHLQVKENEDGKLYVHLLDTPPVHGVKPSADVTLNSLLEIRERSFVVAILTGMGRDGADGITALKDSGADVHVIAESEESCVVFGMPRAAIETNKVDEICRINQVAAAICQQFGLKGDE
ncbi:chemotaxis response regulator protein-glutamate methylesterase [Sporolactobacillus shoreae]|uniref:Protein-glutamate methylesterase/protein-glutamine glutaminase n=1 Tax=Sporolactobacillus shoreae TaxID=1465501 RepID=A0A4Z0GTI7_9BACL|nr:chemotaxis response regulator protein-glutamate methylesterase [Sporolactobacillus shoreae]TGB00300.1 chemotaxis response regulator protein-glutamate methylesterase [Sporolactobacillus shoreae]